MTGFRWRATYRFDYPQLGSPINIGDVGIYPASPEYPVGPYATHEYEFTTERIDRQGQHDAKVLAEYRKDELYMIGALAPEHPDVELISLVLLDSTREGYPPRDASATWEGTKPYIRLGTSLELRKQNLYASTEAYRKANSLVDEEKDSIFRALRWVYRSNASDIACDDKLIYRWIAFNCLYSIYGRLANTNLHRDRKSYLRFENDFRTVVDVVGSGVNILAESGLHLQGDDVSKDLQDALCGSENKVNVHALDCVYSVRCALFHGEVHPNTIGKSKVVSAAAAFLKGYLEVAIPCFVDYCYQARVRSER